MEGRNSPRPRVGRTHFAMTVIDGIGKPVLKSGRRAVGLNRWNRATVRENASEYGWRRRP